MDASQPTPTPTRADGWAVAFAMVFPTVLTYVYFTLLAEASVMVQYVAYSVLKIIQFGFPLYWYCIAQRRPLSLSFRPASAGNMVPTIGFGVVVLVSMWCLFKYLLEPTGMMANAVGPITEKVEGFGVSTLASYTTLAVFYSLAHSGLEEYYWRWFVFRQLRRLVNLPAAIVLSSLGFTAHHVLLLATFFGWASPLTWILSIAIVIGGAAWAWLYHRYGSFYAIWFSHMLIDAGIFFIGADLMDWFGLIPA